jgi:hypothetical protein
MNIKDSLTGNTARVFDGELNTRAIIKSIGSHQSFQKGFVFACTGQGSEPNASSKNIFGITNTSDKFLLLERFSFQVVYPTTSLPSVDEYVSLYLGANGCSGGTAVTAANTNATSNFSGNHEILTDGFTCENDGNIFCKTHPINGVLYEMDLDGMMVLGQNDAMIMKISSASANTDGKVIVRVCFIYLDTLNG